MKFYISQIDQLLSKVAAGSINSILLYGPDKGYISKISELIIKKLSLIVTSVSYNGLAPQQLNMMLNSQNFFGKREFIKITNVSGVFDKEFKIILTANSLHFAAFIADELPPSSAIRKFYESEDNLAVVACYHAEERDIVKIILKKATLASKVIEQEALSYLKLNLKGDFQSITNELDKLLYFVHDKQTVTMQDVQQVLSNELGGSGDEMCIYFSQQKLELFLAEIEKIITQGINEVLILRALIRYYLNIYFVKSKILAGIDSEIAIKQLSPPIFFKYAPNFKNAVSSTTAEEALRVIAILQQAEVDFKSSAQGFDFYHNVYVPVYRTSLILPN